MTTSGKNFTTVYDVLDYGEIELLESMASDLDVVNAARVSFVSYQTEMDERAIGLINFLMRNKHATPFEHSVFKFRIKAPIFVTREWMRHRWSSFNEMSMRYHVPDELHFYVPESKNVRQQIGKPGSYSFQPISDEETVRKTILEIHHCNQHAYTSYKQLLEMGIAKEIARCVLPVSQYTEFIWTVNARSLINFISLRNDSNAQYEINEYAKVIERIFAEKMPCTHTAFINSDRMAI
jgi:thymidylate synthase (FAD)